MHFKKANHSSASISSSDIQLSSIYLQLWKEYKHIFHVFWENKSFRLLTFVRKIKVNVYQVTNVFVKSEIVTFAAYMYYLI